MPFHSVLDYLFDAFVLVLMFLAIIKRPRAGSHRAARKRLARRVLRPAITPSRARPQVGRASTELLAVDETMVLNRGDLAALDRLLARSPVLR